MKTAWKLLALAVSVILSSVLPAAELYRWVDEDGRVHFSDQPRGFDDDEPGVERMQIQGPRPIGQDGDVEAIHQRTQRMLEQQRERDAERAEQRQQEEKRLRQRCEKVRRDIARLSGRVRYQDADGNPYDVSREQVERDRGRQQQWYSRNCK